MESKLNLIAIQEYSEDLARIFTDELDDSRSFFTGKDLLNLNPVKQVNLFILKEIFFGWMAQNQSMRSPYFDFENEEVQKAMNDLMNLLSHHIKLSKEDLRPLYASAINDTILFYLVPDYFLAQLIRDLDETLFNRELFGKLKNYIDLNKSLYESFTAKLADLNGGLTKDKAIEILGNISFEAEEKEIFDYFSSKKNLDIEQFLNIEEEIERTEANNSMPSGKRFEFDNEKIVHEKYRKEELTVNDKLKGSKTPSLVDDMQKSKINSISKSISLNQRFIFIKELFQGNLETYENALSRLDNFNSWEEANEFIEEKVAPENNWDISKSSVAEFTDIVERRYR
jgi:hypothetical protein